jgi:hypothetical protein
MAPRFKLDLLDCSMLGFRVCLFGQFPLFLGFPVCFFGQSPLLFTLNPQCWLGGGHNWFCLFVCPLCHLSLCTLASHCHQVLPLVFMMPKGELLWVVNYNKCKYINTIAFALLGSLTSPILCPCKYLHNKNVIKFYNWTSIVIEHWNIVQVATTR